MSLEVDLLVFVLLGVDRRAVEDADHAVLAAGDLGVAVQMEISRRAHRSATAIGDVVGHVNHVAAALEGVDQIGFAARWQSAPTGALRATGAAKIRCLLLTLVRRGVIWQTGADQPGLRHTGLRSLQHQIRLDCRPRRDAPSAPLPQSRRPGC